jgi:hypothetical protein
MDWVVFDCFNHKKLHILSNPQCLFVKTHGHLWPCYIKFHLKGPVFSLAAERFFDRCPPVMLAVM